MPPDPETPVVETPAAGAPPVVDAAALAAQIAELREQVAEGQRVAQFWADKAKTAAPAKPAAEPEDETDVLEAITTGGAKGFDALAKKRGFIQRDEVQSLIDSKASALTKEQELIGRYPELQNKKSDFFKQTAVHYGELVRSGTPPAIAMELASEKTELGLMREGKIKPANAAPNKEEKEAARLARIKAQGGETRRAAAPEDEGDEELTAQQKHIAAAMGISEEAYTKRAKAGVKMKGLA